MSRFPIFEQWQNAQRAAFVAETALYRAELAHCAGNGPAPDQESIRSTRMLQARARQLLKAAMSEMREAAYALR